MKRTISLLSALAFVLAFSGSAFAQSTQDIQANATVESQISLTNASPVNFAGIQVNSSPVIDPNGSNSQVGAGATNGSLDINASSSTQLVISWNSTSVLSDGSGNTMDFSADVDASQTSGDASTGSDISNGSASAETATDGSGNLYLYIGGSLAVGSSQTSGSYSTSNSGGTPLTITVNYQ